MKSFKFSALLGAMAISLPIAFGLSIFSTPAAAREGQFQMPAVQANPSPQTDAAYLEQLYGFLRRQDASTYTMATQSMSEDDSIWAAQMFCRTFESGVSPADAFSVYTTSAIEQATSLGADVTEEMTQSVGLYGGAVMNFGTAYYCPQYQSLVRQALTSLQ